MSKVNIIILLVVLLIFLFLFFNLDKLKNIFSSPLQTIKSIFIPMSYEDLPFIDKVKENKKEFGEKVITISGELGVDPKWLMAVMNNESGVNHTIKNPNSSATGLIQFTESTANWLGTSTSELKNMTNVEQLDYVKKYLNTYKNEINSLSDTYLSVFYPAALFKNEDYQFPDWAVKANPIFFKSGNTKADFINYVNKKYSYLIQ